MALRVAKAGCERAPQPPREHQMRRILTVVGVAVTIAALPAVAASPAQPAGAGPSKHERSGLQDEDHCALPAITTESTVQISAVSQSPRR
jgi:hypothetical protein